MTRYRIRPREVEAVQWFKNGDHPLIDFRRPDGVGVVFIDDDCWHVFPTDWIVTDATGNRIVKADDFAEQFEEIGDE